MLCVDWQVISLEGWVDIMYNIQDAQSFWSWIYFATLIVVSDAWAYECRVCLFFVHVFRGFHPKGMRHVGILGGR